MSVTEKKPATPHGWLGTAVRDPLTHFVVAGGLLFGAYAIFAPESPSNAADPMQVELTADDMRQIAVVWMSKGRALPTPEELQILAEGEALQRVLVQEAFALGLDQDDEIINRRLAQKMDFLLVDLTNLEVPTTAELRDWYTQNADRFTLPPRVSFQHLYFAVDKRGEEGARNSAAAALETLSELPADASLPDTLADRFMFQNFYAARTPGDVAKEFGPSYAEAVFNLEPGDWQGPVRSGYGWHLVRVSDAEPAHLAALEEVEANVKAAWLDERYREIKARAYEEMLSRYTITIPQLSPDNLQGSQVQPVADDVRVVTQ